MERSLFRRAFSLKNGLWLALGLILIFGTIALAKIQWDNHVFEGYDSDLSLDPEILSSGELDGYPIQKVEITGLSGERIPFKIIRPSFAIGDKVPCVIFLYGIGQNARFFDKIAAIFAAEGFAMAMPEQFQRGERQRKIGPLREVLALRERSSRIVPETRRLVDFLSQAPGIDPARIFLIGASYGGITGPSLLAHEPRIQRAALVMAGGNLPRLLDSLARNQKPDSRIIAPLGAKLAAWMLRPFEPLDYVGKVSPRPLLFLNLNDDEMIDPTCADLLYEHAGNPKEKLVYSGAHNTITAHTVRKMLVDTLDWMKKP